MTSLSSVAIDLFSGGGALSSGLKSTGYRAVGLAEALARQYFEATVAAAG